MADSVQRRHDLAFMLLNRSCPINWKFANRVISLSIADMMEVDTAIDCNCFVHTFDRQSAEGRQLFPFWVRAVLDIPCGHCNLVREYFSTYRFSSRSEASFMYCA